jgi:hypothetical protein
VIEVDDDGGGLLRLQRAEIRSPLDRFGGLDRYHVEGGLGGDDAKVSWWPL